MTSDAPRDAVAAALLFLASPASSYVAGAIIPVDGGWTAWLGAQHDAMIAAIYGRKSTDQNLSDTEKSVTRQIEHATACAARKGRVVDPVHVYQDDWISGAEFVKRAGLARLMNTLSRDPRSRFSSCQKSRGSAASKSRRPTS